MDERRSEKQGDTIGPPPRYTRGDLGRDDSRRDRFRRLVSFLPEDGIEARARRVSTGPARRRAAEHPEERGVAVYAQRSARAWRAGFPTGALPPRRNGDATRLILPVVLCLS